MDIKFETKEIEISPNLKLNDYINDRYFDSDDNEQDFMRLIDSIKTHGLINPLILAYDNKKPEELELICGRRRIKAIREICKETGVNFKAICRILPANTDRQIRNIIAFQDNENRKDLDDEIKFLPLYLLVANSFYKVEQISKNSLVEIMDDKLKVFLQRMVRGDGVDDTKTQALIRNLAEQVKMDERVLVKKLYNMSQIDNNFFKIKQRFHIQTKELLRYRNSDNQEVKELTDEVFFVMNCIHSIKKNTPADIAQDLCDKINKKTKKRIDLNFTLNEWQNPETNKENTTLIVQKYIKEIRELLAASKEPRKKTPSAKKIKTFLKTASDDEIEQILALIEKFEKDKNATSDF